MEDVPDYSSEDHIIPPIAEIPKSLPPIKHAPIQPEPPTSNQKVTSQDSNNPTESAQETRRKTKLESMQASHTNKIQISLKELKEVVNFDARTNPHQVELLDCTYGGVEGMAILLNVNLSTGLEITQKPSPPSRMGKVLSVFHNPKMSAKGAEERNALFGVNRIPPPRSDTILEIVWGTIKEDPILKILVLGACVVLVLGTIMCPVDGWLDGVVIVIAVCLVLGVTAGNDYSKDLKFKKLLTMQSEKRIKVFRGGLKDEISSWDLLVGDVIELSTGDEIPADGIFISGNRVTIDESPLTGETIPVKKNPSSPFMFSGCQVSEGSGKMLVTAVGIHSSGGQIQELLNESQEEETVLQSKLKVVAVMIGKVGVSAGIATFLGLAVRWAIAWAQNKSNIEIMCGGVHSSSSDTPLGRIQALVKYFVIGMTVIVVAVPEGLPLAVTISLAFSMFKMIQEKCFVRHLDAAETMGEATCICTDKTGTLTENKMTVVRILAAENQYSGEGSMDKNSAPYSPSTLDARLRDLFMESVCINSDCFIKKNDAGVDVFIGSATEGALLIMSKKFGIDYNQVRTSVQKVEGGVWNFSSERKRMSTLVVPNAGTPSEIKKYRLYSKGASEIILSLCTHYLASPSSVTAMTPEKIASISKIIKEWASDGLRTIGIAYLNTDQKLSTFDTAEGMTEDPEHDMVWLGLVGIKDPLRKEVPEAVKKCQRAGLTVRMVTGDNILTASKIASECGILFGDGVAMEGPVFRNLSFDEKLLVIPKLQVLARSSPTDKFTLVSILKELGEVVAVTGDGTNDAPAMKEADIGFAMGISGTQIARNASDIVILDDNFSSIVNAIRWGRNVLNSIRKFLQFQLGVNLVAVCLTFFGAVTIGDSPLNTVQLLWVNLIMDSLGALALASDKPDDDILEHPPHSRTASLLSAEMKEYILIQFGYQLIIMLVLFTSIDSIYPMDTSFHKDDTVVPTKRCKTIVFTTFVFLQVANEIMARQLKGEINIFQNFFRNYVFVVIIVIIITIQSLCIVFAGAFFSTSPMTWQEWVICIGLATGNLLFTSICRAIIKLHRYFRAKKVRKVIAKVGSAGKLVSGNLSTHSVLQAKAASKELLVERGKVGARWATVRASVQLIGELRKVQDESFEGSGPSSDFVETWMRFRKDTSLKTKSSSHIGP